MNLIVLGIIVGVILTLFCMFCLDAQVKNSKLSDSEWEEYAAWREEWLRRKEGER